MEYPLPQFLQIKPKVAGPLRFRELAYVIGGSIIAVIFYFVLPSVVMFLVVAIPIILLSLILAFGKVKGFPIPTLLMRSFFFIFAGKKYIWKKTETATPILPKATKEKKGKEKPASTATLKISEKSRLGDIGKLIEIHPK